MTLKNIKMDGLIHIKNELINFNNDNDNNIK